MTDPLFSRKELAKILNVTPLTIANREKRGVYPAPRRDLNRYRVYGLHEVLNLQLITYSVIDPRPIVSVLYDKGYKDPREVAKMIDVELSRRGYQS